MPSPLDADTATAPAGPSGRPVTVALLTPPGRGALAVVGLTGPGSCDLADRRFRPRGGTPLARRPAGAIGFGSWQSLAEAAGEDVIVVKRTSEQLEIHCHGGAAAAAAVIDSLVAAGGLRLPWPAWFEAAGVGEIEREARLALAVAAGPQAARILCRQLAGSLGQEVHRIASLPAADRQPSIDRLLRAARVGLRLACPWRVVLVGEVNAGKSSLANALVGYGRCLVSAEPGTTRDLVSSRIVLDGWEIELFDTAGGRETAAASERAGIERAARAQRDADLVLRVQPADGPYGLDTPASDREIVVVTKADLIGKPLQPPAGEIVTSAVTGEGIDELAGLIVSRLIPEASTDPDLLRGPVPFTSRQVEAIRRLATPASEPRA
ncbi:MAG: 50S ribosome-binding GTPase [Planctomycetota bacterium]|jgi:tRNA modification GTPase|nr:50S ribosome-binding GTPase [Planctomycetota bacterium]